MTAPRTCRRCGAPLPPDVAWCVRCFEPVRHLTPREPQLPPIPDAEPPPAHLRRSPLGDGGPPAVYSRWRAGPTTFGPIGRIVITVIVLGLVPLSGVNFSSAMGGLAFWMLLGYVIFATFVLRHTWRRERVTDPERASPGERLRRRIGARAPVLTRPVRVDARLVMATVAIGLSIVIGLVWRGAGAQDRFVLVSIAVVAAVAMGLAWLNEL